MKKVNKVRIESVPAISYIDDVKEGNVSDNQDVQRFFCSDNGFINEIGVTMLSGDYLPPLIIGEIPLQDNIVQKYIVDGMQRTSAIMKIRYGNYKFTSKIEDDEIEYQTKTLDETGKALKDDDGNFIWEKKTFHLKGHTFDDFPDELKKRFDRFQLTIVTHENCTMGDISILIRRYNNHKAMGASQKALTWIPTYARQVKNIGEEGFFKNSMKYSDTDRKNGNYIQLVCGATMTVFHMDKFKKDAKSANTMLEENSNYDEFETIRSYLQRIEKCCEDKCKSIFVKKDISTWVAVFDKFTKLNLPDSRFAEFVMAIETKLHDILIGEWSYDLLSKEPGTTGKKLISQKIETYTALMMNYLHIDDKTENNEVAVATDDNEMTDIEFVHNTVNANITDDDIQDYKDYIEDTVRMSSPLYHQAYQALLAMVAYVFENDCDLQFEKWVDDYSNNTYEFSKNMEENYEAMKTAFLRDLGESKVA